jgi:hypothetical protein
MKGMNAWLFVQTDEIPSAIKPYRSFQPPWHQIVILLHQITLILNLHRNNRCLYLFFFPLALDSLFRCRFGAVFSGKNLGGEVRLLVFGRKEDDKKKPDRIRSADTRTFSQTSGSRISEVGRYGSRD